MTIRPSARLRGATLVDVIMSHADARGMQYEIRWGAGPRAASATSKMARAFQGPLLGGGVYDFGQVAGHKAAVLTFWASWCEPCVKEAPHLEALWKDLGPKGLEVVSVSIDVAADKDAVRAEVNRLKLTYPVVLDPDGRILALYAENASIPLTFVISPDGEVVYQHGNYKPGDELPLAKAVRQQLQ